MKSLLLFLLSCGFTLSLKAQVKNESNAKAAADVSVAALKFRSVGPALTSGRVIDLAVSPTDANTWFVAAASGGVWKTQNHGNTFTPVFDTYGSYSIACVEIAASNPNTIWVGTGENNNQRSVAYGDGVYKSVDGGKSFTRMGLQNSEHIGNIIIHPSNENIVWVAAYGPLWSSGGERGVYKSTDGGKTFERTLFVSDETGISEIAIDPRNPDILYAAAHQRRRHEWTYVGGGPESGLYKSTDGGKTWQACNNGLPAKEMGRIGLAVSMADPDYVYAIVEARGDKGGIYLSTNKGGSWSKMSGYSTSGNYYQEIFCDPLNRDKIFVMDTWLHHSNDGGKTVVGTGEELKHVDNHCIWVDPQNTAHWLVGCDGGLYETYSHAREWRYYDNLPITQFYKVATDNALPFYHIYGGTQDNNSMGGPSATRHTEGIANSDWFITWGGDGFESAIDPVDPDIAYSQSQYGGLVRVNRKTGETFYIQPLPAKGENGLRWNWDAPLIISAHNNQTLYFAANRLYKSNNRGDDWFAISPDLTRQTDRNKLKVMGQVWSIDAVMKNQSTSWYGNIIALDESPKKAGLIYVGTDDGLIQVTENGGQGWTRIEAFAGVPANTRVNMITASLFDENVVFAAFVNQRSGDFKPYLMKSTDKGKTWISIAGDLPARGSVYCIKQDHVNKDLLFCGTEFGAWYSVNGGVNWKKLSGLPTIAVYDLDIQRRENDLVAATFGRGFYVLDNYTPLRNLNAEILQKPAYLFPVKDALLYVPSGAPGLAGTGSQGHNFWNAKNPEYGATFTLYMKDGYQSMADKRKEKELKLEQDKKDVFYPTWDELRNEVQEEETKLIWIIRNSEGKEVRKIVSGVEKGLSRVCWNLRTESTSPVNPNKPKPGRYDSPDDGYLVTAGKYLVEVVILENGRPRMLIDATPFTVKNIDNNGTDGTAAKELAQFRNVMADMQRSITGSAHMLQETREKAELMKYATENSPGADLALLNSLRNLRLLLDSCQEMLYGNGLRSSHEFETAPTFYGRLGYIQGQLMQTTHPVTETQIQNLQWIRDEYEAFRVKLEQAMNMAKTIEKALDDAKIPYLKNKDANWKKEKD